MIEVSAGVARRSGMLLVPALLLAGLCCTSLHAQTGDIAGTVTDATTGDPVPWAIVHAHAVAPGGGPGMGGGPGGWWGSFALTGLDGQYTIANRQPGDYTVTVHRFGYLDASADVAVVAGETTVADFALEAPSFGTVAGLVTDEATGDPVPGALVVLRRDIAPGGGLLSHLGRVRFAFTGVDGSYTVEHVRAGDYTARVRKPGYASAGPVDLTVIADETTTVDFALAPLAFGDIAGTVTDGSTGDPVEGALVLAHRLAPTPGGGLIGHWRVAHTDADGTYLLEQLATGEVMVRVFHPDYIHASSPATVTEGATTTVDFALEPR